MTGRRRLFKVRKALWHLRRGGFRQLCVFRERHSNHSMDWSSAHGAMARRLRAGGAKRLGFPSTSPKPRKPRRADITVAVILDEFSTLAFAYEWNLVVLARETWRSQLSETRCDFLFVESAWSGNGGEWKYQLTGASGVKPDFLELMRWCRAAGLPTVFWNKEDPPHYNDFLSAAREFDVVFTSDSNMHAAYRRDLGHERVHTLRFAAQPAIHNPVRPVTGWRERDIAFAGMYFANKYPERRQQMGILLGGALDVSDGMATGLEIFARQLGGAREYQFPEPFARRVVGCLPYDQMLTAYKAYKVFLNVNSVTASPSMCARRIFEITAAGTPVLSTPSEATRAYFDADELAVVTSRLEAGLMARALVRNPELSDRMVHKAQRKIWGSHTYSHRAEELVSAVLPGRSRPIAPPTVSALVSTIRPEQLNHVFRTIGAQKTVDIELVLLTHGFQISSEQLEELLSNHGIRKIVVLYAGPEVSLGECLNRCVTAAGGIVLAKMDDDDYYGPNYLADQLQALRYSGADVVGKQAHYLYVEARNATMLRFPTKEHRFTNLVMGPTLTAHRDVFASHPFQHITRGEDTRFLQDVLASGGAVYSADRFNYFQHRRESAHTWNIATEELLASSDVQFFGHPLEHVTV